MKSKAVFSFDRDYTVDVNQGPVPLDWIKKLKDHEECVCWAHGNQRLKQESGIPGIEEAHQRAEDETLSKLGLSRDPTVLPPRKKRLYLIGSLYSSSTKKVCVDDVNLSRLKGWDYYPPSEFVETFDPFSDSISVLDELVRG